MSSVGRSSCIRCGIVLQADDPAAVPRVTVTLTAPQLLELAMRTEDTHTRWRLTCALGLIDAKAERALRAKETASFNDEPTGPGIS